MEYLVLESVGLDVAGVLGEGGDGQAQAVRVHLQDKENREELVHARPVVGVDVEPLRRRVR